MNTHPESSYSTSAAIDTAAADAGLTGEQLDQIIETNGRKVVGGYDMRPGRKGEATILAAIRSHAAAVERAADIARLGGPAATPAQRDYLADLGATPEQIDQCTKATASALIDELKRAQREAAIEQARQIASQA